MGLHLYGRPRHPDRLPNPNPNPNPDPNPNPHPHPYPHPTLTLTLTLTLTFTLTFTLTLTPTLTLTRHPHRLCLGASFRALARDRRRGHGCFRPPLPGASAQGGAGLLHRDPCAARVAHLDPAHHPPGPEGGRHGLCQRVSSIFRLSDFPRFSEDWLKLICTTRRLSLSTVCCVAGLLHG